MIINLENKDIGKERDRIKFMITPALNLNL